MHTSFKLSIVSIALMYSSIGVAVSEQEQLFQARFSLVGIITEKAATKKSKDKKVAVIKDHGNGEKNYTLSLGEYFPGNTGLQIIAMDRNEITVFDGQKRFAITYQGREADPSRETWEALEQSNNYAGEEEEVSEDTPVMVERLGEYRYVMKDGIYTLVKSSATSEEKPASAAETTTTPSGTSGASYASLGDKSESSAKSQPATSTQENSDSTIGSSTDDSSSDTQVFRPAVTEKKVWEGLKLLPEADMKSNSSCDSAGGTCFDDDHAVSGEYDSSSYEEIPEQ